MSQETPEQEELEVPVPEVDEDAGPDPLDLDVVQDEEAPLEGEENESPN